MFANITPSPFRPNAVWRVSYQSLSRSWDTDLVFGVFRLPALEIKLAEDMTGRQGMLTSRHRIQPLVYPEVCVCPILCFVFPTGIMRSTRVRYVFHLMERTNGVFKSYAWCIWELFFLAFIIVDKITYAPHLSPWHNLSSFVSVRTFSGGVFRQTVFRGIVIKHPPLPHIYPHQWCM
jgi:hypothetical protein